MMDQLFCAPLKKRQTGAILSIHESTHATLATRMILQPAHER